MRARLTWLVGRAERMQACIDALRERGRYVDDVVVGNLADVLTMRQALLDLVQRAARTCRTPESRLEHDTIRRRHMRSSARSWPSAPTHLSLSRPRNSAGSSTRYPFG